MQEIGTQKIGSNITNSHIKTNDDCKLEDRFQKKAISGLHMYMQNRRLKDRI